MISVELNTAVRKHLDEENPVGKKVEILPLLAYENTEAPFIVYSEEQSTFSDEQWFMRQSNIIYYVYDNNISRMKDLSHAIDKFLNVGDNVQHIMANLELPGAEYGDYRYRLASCRKIIGSVFPATEREGFSGQMSIFSVVYLDQDIEP